jgi:hypothetical protein
VVRGQAQTASGPNFRLRLLLPRRSIFDMKLQLHLAILLALVVLPIGCSHQPRVIKTCRIVATAGTSVWDQTRTHYRVEYDSSGAGVFVKSIDGVPQSRSTFWLFYVNSAPASVSCEELLPAAGDTIEWRLVEGL